MEEHEHEPEAGFLAGERGWGPVRRLLAAFGVLVAGAAFFATYYWWTRQGRRAGEVDEAGEPPDAAQGGAAGEPAERARHNGGGLHLPRRLRVYVPGRRDGGETRA